MTNEPSDMEHKDYLAFVEAVFKVLHSQLGGDPNQQGPDRRYGEGEFTCHALNNKGDMQFRVSMPKALVRPTPRYVTIEWRSLKPLPEKAAEQVLAEYEDMRKEVL